MNRPPPLRAATGSPPRAWGNHAPGGVLRGFRRFTPTCVGKSYSGGLAGAARTVHPHVRGEILKPEKTVPFGNGSPPRAWGNPVNVRGAFPLVRFTPTCVGKSPSLKPLRSSTTVHPHVRGEIGLAKWMVGAGSGSPPRAWGNRASVSLLNRLPRFTPTCVGKSVSARRHTACDPVHPHVRGEIVRVGSFLAPPFGSPPRAWGNLLYR